MALRTVRLDEESERKLAKVQQATGLSVSAVLVRGLAKVERELEEPAQPGAFEIYKTLDLGPGGYSIAPANAAKQAVRDAIRRKHRR